MNTPEESLKQFLMYIQTLPKEDRIIAYNVYILLLLRNVDESYLITSLLDLRSAMLFSSSHKESLLKKLFDRAMEDHRN